MNPSAPSDRSLPLWNPGERPDAVGDGFVPSFDTYLLTTDKPLGAVLVLPGGGYGGRAAHEGGPIAQRANAAGYHAFVLHYSVAPRRHPLPVQDAYRVIRRIRARAAEWAVSPSHLAVLGFSAGGHLAASTGTLWNRDFAADPGPFASIPNRPDANILCYPVISSGTRGHAGSFNNLLGPNATPQQKQDLSLELHAGAHNPPTFFWHTANDAAVPVENSLLMAAALQRANVPWELHVYPDGRHGLGLAPELPHVATWMPLAMDWLKSIGFPAAW